MNTKRLTFCALLTAIALTIFMVEAQIPPIVPVPGVKLGLANIVTVYAMFALGPADALMILLSRIFLGALFAGGSTFLYSLAGGLLCYLCMLLLRKLLTIFHNIGQIGVAIAIAKTPQLIMYLPILLLTGVIAGTFTGFAAQFLVNRLDGRLKF